MKMLCCLAAVAVLLFPLRAVADPDIEVDPLVYDFGDVVVGETATIGERVRIYQGVTLGALSLPKEEVEQLRYAKRHPTIEDDVTIYAGATILGGETIIGAGSVIGGSVWITRSVPPGTKVFLSPPKLLYKNAESEANAR